MTLVIFLSPFTKSHSTKGISYLMIRILITKFPGSENIIYFMCQKYILLQKSQQNGNTKQREQSKRKKKTKAIQQNYYLPNTKPPNTSIICPLPSRHHLYLDVSHNITYENVIFTCACIYLPNKCPPITNYKQNTTLSTEHTKMEKTQSLSTSSF